MSNLTEQLKKGELPDGFYYFRLSDGEAEIASEYKLFRYNLTKDADKIEILAPVPTYQEYLESEAHCAVYSEVNKQLRQLLKECRDDHVSTNLYDDLLLNQDMAQDLVTRINVAIGKSEE